MANQWSKLEYIPSKLINMIEQRYLEPGERVTH
jgi:hypothetical protein